MWILLFLLIYMYFFQCLWKGFMSVSDKKKIAASVFFLSHQPANFFVLVNKRSEWSQIWYWAELLYFDQGFALFLVLMGELHGKSKLSTFCTLSQIINTVLKNEINKLITKASSLRNSKNGIKILVGPNHFWVIDQNSISRVLINNL